MLVNEMIRRGARYFAEEIAVLFSDERLTIARLTSAPANSRMR
jgi:hypothetical protein